MLHHLLEAHVHESHAVLERASETVTPPVGIGRQELRYQVSVAGMDFHAVKAGVAGRIDGLAELAGERAEFILTETADKCRAVEIETCRSAHRSASGRGAVRHITAMAYLD